MADLFVTSPKLKEKYGKDFKLIPPGALGIYTYIDRLTQGLQQLMAGERKFVLKHIDRNDICALTRDAAEMSGVAYVMDADREKGMDPEALVKYKQQTGTLQGFPGADSITNEELLELEVTVLFPFALEQVITEQNADKIKCKISCELANGPATPEADDILYQNNIFVIPDFLANAGGVTVSYFEQVQNTYNYYWELDEIYHKLDIKMTHAFHNVYAMSQQEKINMRQAAYLVSVTKVAEACRLRGWI